jgi:2-desacetyl-2-hydroxyethyl bacteriochlorophyllide A dehydrogenase
VQMFETCLVIGSGPIGLAVAQFAEVSGGRVTIVDTNPQRRQKAESFGLKAYEVTDELFDIVFDCTGNKASMETAPTRAAFGGTIVFVGLVSDRVSFDDPLFHRRELSILASRNSAGAFPTIISLLEHGRIETRPWITHRLKLDDVVNQFESVFLNGDGVLKGVVGILD